MKPPNLGGLVHVGLDVLATTISTATKKILALTGSVVKDATDADSVEWWQHVGFASRPPKPDAGKSAAQCVVLKTSDRDAAIASQDLRGLELYGNLDHGETCVYAPGTDGKGQARALFKKNGSISLYTRVGNSPTGAGMLLQLDAENDAIRITNGKGYGLIIDADGVRAFSGGTGGGLTLTPGGDVSLIGTGKCLIDGATICFGATATPATAVCVGPAGIAAIGSPKIFGSLA